MRFVCTKDALEKVLVVAERFTGKSVTLPILGNFLIEAEKNTLTVTATNLEYAIQSSIVGHVGREGKVSVPAKIITSLIQSTHDEKVDLEEKQGNLLVKAETRNIKINGVSPDDFPLLPKIKKSFSCSVDAALLSQGVGRVLPAVSISEFKPELNGILFHISSGHIRLAATDTFRLAESSWKLSKKRDRDESFSFITPHRVVQEVGRFLAGRELEVKIAIGENQILFETPGTAVFSRLIEGKFPEYSGIIPTTFETTSFLKRDHFVNAIRSSSIFSSKLQDVTVALSRDAVVLSTKNSEVGEYTTTLPAATTGKDVTVNFNYRYLLDGLGVLEDEEIFIGCNAEGAPVLLRNKSNEDFLYVLMPIRFT